LPKKRKEESGFLIGPKLPSTLKAINSMYGGGHIPGILYNVFGPPMGGKTILMIQEAFGDVLAWEELYGEKKAILYIDTEGGGEGVLSDWYPVFSKRFGIRPKVIYKDIRDLLDLLTWFGYPAKIFISEKGGQVYIRPKGMKIAEGKKKVMHLFNPNPPALDYCNKHNVGTVIIDSITEPIDQVFVGGTPQFPGRAEAVNAWFGRIHQVAKASMLGVPEEDITRRVVRCILHESVDPANDWVKPMIKGGHNVKYKFKVAMHLQPSAKNNFEHIKKLRLARYFSKKGWAVETLAILTDNGYIDPTKAQAEEMWADSRLFHPAPKSFSSTPEPKKKKEEQTQLDE